MKTPERAPTLIAVGETMLMFAADDGSSFLEAQRFIIDAAGAESNVAAHLRSRGFAAAWVGNLGNDHPGRRVHEMLVTRGVDLRWVGWVDDAPTGLYVKNPGGPPIYYRSGSAGSRLCPASIRDVPLETAAIVHTSGITAALSDSSLELVNAIIDRLSNIATTTLSFDINFRPSLWTSVNADAEGTLQRIARQANVTFVGLDEAELLWGTRSPTAVRRLVPNPTVLVVKDAARGAYEFAGSTKTFVAAPLVDVVEATGAGDAFAAGYLAGMIQGKDAAGRLQSGHDQAAMALRSVGDFLSATESPLQERPDSDRDLSQP